MTWDSVNYYTNCGFVILEFEDLLPYEAEIEESEQSLDFLLN